MRENRINWKKFFKPVCVLCILMGGYWLWLQTTVTGNPAGWLALLAGGVLFFLAGVFGLIGKPRFLVPLLDFFALAAALCALWKIGAGWQEIAGVVLAMLYLLGCNAETIVGDGDENIQPDYSELHPYWENMETVKKQFEERDRLLAEQAAQKEKTSHGEEE